MPALPPPLRKQLEKTILAAREVAEAGALATLNALAVGASRFHEHMSADERLLRNQLRAHGRTLGDKRQSDDTQELTRLVREVAYEHWHRMLFARFLAENGLLIHDTEQVAVTLQDVEEFAAEERTDIWTLAGRFASKMLPQVFRPDDPALALRFAAEHQKAMEAHLESLPADVFTASDALGWVYQYWQAKRKEEVNKSNDKVGADELPAVTQLFTENYMVRFLLHNTVGAWFASRKFGNGLSPAEGGDEGSWRKWAAEGLGGYEFDYLRFMPDGTPAAGTFPGWPRMPKDLRVLDPCCGSGHFLIEVFDLLVRLRMAVEGLGARDAVDAVLRDNLFGLELDPRCTQIAAFNVAMAAWSFPGAGGYRELPRLNIACSGLGIGGKREDWLALADGNDKFRAGMERLHRLFQNAPTLGSLIDPRRALADGSGGMEDMFQIDFTELESLLATALAKEKVRLDFDTAERGVAAQGLAEAARLLAARYTLVITNVPYLARGKQDETLKDYIETHHDRAKADIATAFVERGLAFCATGGTTALVTPQNWLFLGSYKKLREELLKSATWNMLVKLGEGGFASPQAAGAFTCLPVLSNAKPAAGHELRGLDASEPRKPEEKAALLRGEAEGAMQSVSQKDQLANPDARVVLEAALDAPLLERVSFAHKGLTTNDDPTFLRKFWEADHWSSGWEYFQTTVDATCHFGGLDQTILYEGGSGRLRKLSAAQDRDRGRDRQGVNAWGKQGVAVSLMRSLCVSRYLGAKFDTNVSMIVPPNPAHLPAIWCFCSSPDFNEAVRKIDQKLNVTNATLVKVPFDLAHWQAVAAEKYPNGLPEPYSDDPTQWIFHGAMTPSEAPLQVAVARLLGYRWPEEQQRRKADTGYGNDALSDEDGIVCLVRVRGEETAADRLRGFLASAYGAEWSPQREQQLLADVGYGGRTLEEWLREGFFEQHLKLFHQTPFLWHVWDGLPEGFAALVNYHKLDARRLEILTYSYLGDWIAAQRDAAKRNVSGADRMVLAAEALQEQLKKIADGEPPYDIFVRWKPLKDQSIGWQPDLNDGVRMNIRPWMTAEIPAAALGRAKPAGILRRTPNIKWGKDRGREPERKIEDYPWFWDERGQKFVGDRVNDVHLTRAEKEAARRGKKAKS